MDNYIYNQSMEKKSHTQYKHEPFGYKLNTIMIARNISNQQLATMMTVAPTTISGRRASDVHELVRLAEALQVSVDELIG